MRHIQKALTGRVIKALVELAEENPDDYRVFWKEFGAFIKEGVAMSPLDHDNLIPLLRFHASESPEGLIALDEYVAQMGEEQKAIYYVLGDDLASVARSPHLDYFKAHNLNVLYLVDPLDGFMMQSLREYKGKPLQNVDDTSLDLPEAVEAEETEEFPQASFDELIARFKLVLGEEIMEVRESKLLVDNPCRLVSPESGPERDLQRVRRLLEQDFEIPPKVLEINRRHPLIQNLAAVIQTDPDNTAVNAIIEQLFENLLLLEGLHPNPAQMVPRIQTLLQELVKRD